MKKEIIERIKVLEQEIAKLKNGECEWLQFTFKGKKYELSETLGEMSWQDGIDKCKKLGGTLPPRWLLVAIFDEQELLEVKKTFEAGYHWSSTEYSDTYAWYRNFGTGTEYNTDKTDTNYVRCVIEVV